jgi:MoaA/NifB/PqqE/SkfB family radical SAM enzyme
MTDAKQATITYDGVEIPDFGERQFPYGIIEVTRRCNLRCETCFFFQAFQHEDDDLPEDLLLASLRALQRRHGIKFMSWVGGEPLLRRRVVEAAADIFPVNVMFTNGLLPIPDLPVAIGVSLDGPPAINDAVRGKGVYEKVTRNLRAAPRSVFIQCVVTQRNVAALESFTATLTTLPNVTGVIFSIYVPQRDDRSGLSFTLAERDRVTTLLLDLKDRYGAFILNERRALELALSATSRQVTDHCDMKVHSLALDYRLRRRRPCCYGENVDCDLCAAPTPFSLAARTERRLMPGAGSSIGVPDGLSQALTRAANAQR